jgi:hypothetical protein
MSCIKVNPQGGDPGIFPLSVDAMAALQRDGGQAIRSMFVADPSYPSTDQHIGVATRADKRPFYLTTFAPSLAESAGVSWQGGFYAPFGVGNVAGTVVGQTMTGSVESLTVAAKLLIQGNENVSVEWAVIGSSETTPNTAALIQKINIVNPGPHDPDDLRRCIALHAPQQVFGEPKAIVAKQCGVAVSCLIEAIC